LAVLLELNSELQSLEKLIAQAIAQAKAQGESVLLCYSQDWQQVDGLEILALNLNPKEPKSNWFFWEQTQLRLVGVGRAIEASGIGGGTHTKDNRFSIAQQFGQKYLAKAVIGGDTSLGEILPIGIAGFSFHDLPQDDRSWWQFPRFQVYVPQWILRQVPGHSILSLNFLVNRDSAIAEISAQFQQQLIQLQRLTSESLKKPKSTNSEDLIQNQITYTEVEGDRSWTEMVGQAKELIEKGELTKIVLARSLEVRSLHPIDPMGVLRNLRRDYPECVSFGINLGGASFVGSTPEFLLQFNLENGLMQLKSDALAGSIQRGKNPIEDEQLGLKLLQSRKYRQEHQIVVNFIRDRLQQIGISLAPIFEPHLLQLRNVQHLRTAIEASFSPSESFQALAILSQLHPTAAMGGEPREKALAIMQQWEASDRGWYAAPIGWFSGNQIQETGAFVVGIRSGYLEGDRARIFAGNGIVAESELDMELAETNLKFAALLEAIK
jgi:menaquinone-specific isochorismate synthase